MSTLTRPSKEGHPLPTTGRGDTEAALTHYWERRSEQVLRHSSLTAGLRTNG
jgi:hypothetical protein